MESKELFELIADNNPWWFDKEVDLPKIHRSEFYDIEEALKERRITSVLGPRRTGKSTLLLQLIQHLIQKGGVNPKDIIYISLDDPAFELYSQKPIQDTLELYQEKVLRKNLRDSDRVYFFIDEVQYSDLWERWLKRYYEQRLNIKFIISGSSSTHLQKGSKESLLGRIYEFELPPLKFSQFVNFHLFFENKSMDKINQFADKNRRKTIGWLNGNTFNTEDLELLKHKKTLRPLLNQYTLAGGFPEYFEIKNLKKWQERLNSDVLRKAIYRDIASQYKVRVPENLEKLFIIISQNTGSTFSKRSLSKDLDMSLESVSKYLQYLASAFLITESLVYSGSAKKQMRSNRKYYPIDPGLRNAVTGTGRDLIHHPEEQGLLIELLVHTHCKATFGRANYWKKRGEVDVITEIKGKPVPIESKYTDDISGKRIRGLLNFLKEHNLKKGIVVTDDLLENRTIEEKEVLFLPAWLFLSIL